ncbi:hypothetical protein ACFX19_023327 [Malus domestica]|uniref:Uncharacterized protein n=1 Tax=Malus domestica TaxID=3750 RepID=A0A498HPA9_MALDO|nr:hypothetical protein DVH24_015623 [Malus domestica]
MEKGEGSMAEQDEAEETQHHRSLPSGLTQDEFDELKQFVNEFHKYQVGPGKCSSLLAQRVHAPPDTRHRVVGGAALRPAPDLQALHPEL